MKNTKQLTITVIVSGAAKDLFLAMCAYDERTPEQATARALAASVVGWSDSVDRRRVERIFEKQFRDL